MKNIIKYSALSLLAIFFISLITFSLPTYIGMMFAIPYNSNFTFAADIFRIVLHYTLFGCLYFSLLRETPKRAFLTGLIVVAITTIIPIPFLNITLISILSGFIFYGIVYVIFWFLKTRNKLQPISMTSTQTYFTVSIPKFCLMFLVTFGWYKIFWWYKQWQFIKLHSDKKISPVLRSIFPVFFYKDFLNHVNQTCRSNNSPIITSSNLLNNYYWGLIVVGILFGLFIGFNLAGTHTQLNICYSFILSLSILLLTLVLFIVPQRMINRMNLVAEQKINKNISVLNFCWMLFCFTFIWALQGSMISFAVRGDVGNAYVLADYKQYEGAYEKALPAAQEGDAKAKFLVAKLLINGLGVTKNVEQGIAWLKDAAQQNNPDADLMLGELYQSGEDNLPKDTKLSAQLYQKAVAQGSAFAANNLAIQYGHGDGVPKNLQKERQLYEFAAGKGDSSAMYNLGFLSSTYEPTNYALAAQWFENSINTEPTSCAYNDLGMLYAAGKGVKQDTKKSLKLLHNAGLLLQLDYDFIKLMPEPEKMLRDPKIKSIMDTTASAFADLQYAKALKLKNDTLKAKYSPATIKTAEDMSQKIISTCWS